MFPNKTNKKIVILIFVIIAIVGVWFVLDFIQIGPGLPPPEAMPRWYIPDASKGKEQACSSFFSKISPYCNIVNISEGKIMNVWYFDDKSEFLKQAVIVEINGFNLSNDFENCTSQMILYIKYFIQ